MILLDGHPSNIMRKEGKKLKYVFPLGKALDYRL
jgi:hypothetical protein